MRCHPRTRTNKLTTKKIRTRTVRTMSRAALSMTDVSIIVSKVDARELTKRGEPIVRSTVGSFGKRATEMLSDGIVFNAQNKRVVAFIDKWGAERVSKVNRYTQKRLRTVLMKGIGEGKGYTEVAKDIRQVFDVAKSRAVTIARTEIHRASTFASTEGYKQAGADQKEWQHSAGGDNPREDHEAMDGQVVGIDDEFTSPSGNTAPYPGEFGDPQDDVNCQCGVLPVTSDKRLRTAARGWVRRFLPRLRRPYEKRMTSAMRGGFAAQHKTVMAEFEKRADKASDTKAA